jgi:SMI1 / KNR4 family (SUKH-1)
MALEHWHQLISSIEVIDSPLMELMTSEEILTFEQSHNLLLPQDYKDFCQVLGTGQANKYLNIYSPTDSLIRQQELIRLTMQHVSNFPSSSIQQDLLKTNLLANSFMFGDDSCGCMYMWDLRTYSDLDSSYDIYCGVWDSPADSFEREYQLMGRSFLEFAEKYIFQGIISEMDPNIPDEIMPVSERRFEKYRYGT